MSLHIPYMKIEKWDSNITLSSSALNSDSCDHGPQSFEKEISRLSPIVCVTYSVLRVVVMSGEGTSSLCR